ncbi:Aste57867_8283 [Aphanomyces stellatus]|uniref:Aste57867_8283 protein n=1 Tax=Aphanomyces stellatus TaxID=120398 RepID=A0A485KJV5_9STRA|nr:hypothetical protein As57867_008252 [Aphanomyces stellatus]VFT85170.1 Aste57867_8283 [Aphanomyces stellatus]
MDRDTCEQLRSPDRVGSALPMLSPGSQMKKKRVSFPRANLWSWKSPDCHHEPKPPESPSGSRRPNDDGHIDRRTSAKLFAAAALLSPPKRAKGNNGRSPRGMTKGSRRLSSAMHHPDFRAAATAAIAVTRPTTAEQGLLDAASPIAAAVEEGGLGAVEAALAPVGDDDDDDDAMPQGKASTTTAAESDIEDEPYSGASPDDYMGDDVHDKFWDVYATGPNLIRRPDSSRGRYIRRCENEALLPLPVFDLRLQKAPQPRYTDHGELQFRNYFLGDKRAEAVGDALELLPVHVTSVSMVDTGMTGQGGAAVVKGVVKDDLIELNFSHNRVGVKGYMKLNAVLDNAALHLKVLNLSNNNLGDQSVSALVRALLKRCTLTTLDLSHNKVFHSATILGELLRVKSSLTRLDLSWNQIRGEPACQLVQSMVENNTLVDLVLSDNSLGNSGGADIQLAASLLENKTLRRLNISNNHIKGRSIFVFVDVCSKNTTLESLNVGNNPIGTAGVEAILYAMATSSMQCEWEIADCNIDIQEYLYSHTYCTGPYTLNLTDRSDLFVLKELLTMYMQNRLLLSNVVHDGRPLVIAKGQLPLPPNAKAEKGQVPTHGVLSFLATQDEESCPDLHLKEAQFQKLKQLIGTSFALDEYKKMTMIKILADGFCVTVKQANQLLRLFESPTCQSEKASAAVALIPRISNSEHHTMDDESYMGCAGPIGGVFFEDKDNDGKIDVCGDITVLVGLTNLSQIEQGYVEQKLGKWIAFNPANPTGFYRLNMSNYVDRRIMLRLIEANAADRKFRLNNKLPDVSQHGTNNGFRNARYNHKPIVLDASWSLPRFGVLEFDFVVTRRPPHGAIAITDAAFEQFFKEFKAIPDMKLVGLRAISNRYYFTARHAQRLMEYFSPYEKIQNVIVRLEVFVILLGRIVDEENFNDALSVLDSSSRKKLLDRVGIVQVFNPISPCGKYELNLAEHDQRFVALILLQLARADEGTLQETAFDGKDVPDVLAMWGDDTEVPTQGLFKCKFMTTNRCHSIVQLHENSVRRRISTTLLFKPNELAT